MFTKLHAVVRHSLTSGFEVMCISDDMNKLEEYIAAMQLVKSEINFTYSIMSDIRSDIAEKELKEVHLVQANVNAMILNLAAYEEEHHAFDAVQSLKDINPKCKYSDEVVPILKEGELPTLRLPHMHIALIDKGLYSMIVQVSKNVYVLNIVGYTDKVTRGIANAVTLGAAHEKSFTGDFKTSDEYTIDTIVLDSIQDITFYRVVHNDDFIGKSLQDFEVVNHLNVVFEKFSENNII